MDQLWRQLKSYSPDAPGAADRGAGDERDDLHPERRPSIDSDK